LTEFNFSGRKLYIAGFQDHKPRPTGTGVTQELDQISALQHA
jgi:hypothetical protein